MAKKKRLSPNQLAKEKAYFENLKAMEGYRSQNPEYEIAAIQSVVDEVDETTAREATLLAEIAEVRDILAEKGTELAAKNDGAAIQVAAQFGEDSSQYQSLGRKRKSERLTRGRTAPSENTP